MALHVHCMCAPPSMMHMQYATDLYEAQDIISAPLSSEIVYFGKTKWGVGEARVARLGRSPFWVCAAKQPIQVVPTKCPKSFGIGPSIAKMGYEARRPLEARGRDQGILPQTVQVCLPFMRWAITVKAFANSNTPPVDVVLQ